MIEEAESVKNIPWLALDLAKDQAVDRCLTFLTTVDNSLKDWEKR